MIPRRSGFGMRPADAQKVSVVRGVWERLDDLTFANSAIATVVDSLGETLYTAKFGGTNTLDAGYDSMTLEGTLEFFLPGANPLTDEPFLGPVPGGEYTADRITLD